MTLTEFLLARIAEDEQSARDTGADAMTGTRWKHWPEDAYNEIQAATLDHCRRVLVECEAKRRIVEREAEELHRAWRARAEEHMQTFEQWFTKPYGATLRDLASVYADHPDYRDEWRPVSVSPSGQ